MKQLFLLFLTLCSIYINAQTDIQNVDAKTFKSLMKDKNAVLIDLRTDDEITRKGMIPGAIQIDFFKPEAEKILDTLDRKKTYLVYCAGGGRSSECAELMEKKSFKKVVNLEKGFDDWKKQGFETQQRPPR